MYKKSGVFKVFWSLRYSKPYVFTVFWHLVASKEGPRSSATHMFKTICVYSALEPQVPETLCFHMVLKTVPTRCHRGMFKNHMFYNGFGASGGFLRTTREHLGSYLEPLGSSWELFGRLKSLETLCFYSVLEPQLFKTMCFYRFYALYNLKGS